MIRIITASTAIGITLCLASVAWAIEPWQRIAPLQALVGDRTPLNEGLQLNLPALSDDGASVPVTLIADLSVPEDVRLSSLHLFASDNPSPEVADFYLPANSGMAEISTRIRLNGSQTLYAAAQTSDGRIWVAGKDIRITVSGCLVGAQETSSFFTRPRIGLPRNMQRGQAAEFRILVDHPMETGLRENEGQKVPAHYVNQIDIQLNDQEVLQARLHRSISANPYLRFLMVPEAGNLRVTWQDNQGHSLTETRELTLP